MLCSPFCISFSTSLLVYRELKERAYTVHLWLYENIPILKERRRLHIFLYLENSIIPPNGFFPLKMLFIFIMKGKT